MKIKVPSKTIEVCDFCKRDGHGCLTRCVICGKDYCHSCEAMICGCIHQPEICKSCGENEGVKDVILIFAGKLKKLLHKRDYAMRLKFLKSEINNENK
jgi:hypothetical protein